ncbi:MAG TPA: YrhA family protein [Terriglobia bacterium]|nr:YrhA family protein [Terriglobia bacterium]
MYRDLLNTVAEEQRRFGSEPQPRCTETQLERLVERVMSELAAELPEEYKDFLRLADGLDWNGLVIYASERIPIASNPDQFIRGFVEMNWTYREDDRFRSLVVFGSDGMDIYTYNQLAGTYEIYDEVPHELIETLPSFGDMMTRALTRCLH